MLLLTTKGRQSGRAHTVPLGFLMEEDLFVVIASYRGSPRNPAWYLNLQNEPQVTVQVGERNIAVIAKTADAEARARLWNQLVAKTPIYQRFQDHTSRQIPVVYLVPVDSGVET